MQSTNTPTLLPTSDPRWMEFIQTFPNANIFHHPAWLDLMQACYGYTGHILAVFDEGATLRAGLPFMEVSSPFTGRRWVALPFSDYCLPLARDQAALEQLTANLARLSAEKRLKIEVRWKLPEHPALQPASSFVLHTIPLEPDPLCVAKKMKRTHLQNIHTAEDRGVRVEYGDQMEQLRIFYLLQLETRRRHGVPAQPWRYFELLWKHIIKPGLGFVLLAHKDGEYLAGMVYLNWGGTLIAKYAASREDRFNLRPNNLLFWEGIRWGCENGCHTFDMGRTEEENAGLRNFKSRWGAAEEPLFYSYFASNKPAPAGNKKIASLMHTIIRKSPVWVCQLSGELLYKHFG